MKPFRDIRQDARNALAAVYRRHSMPTLAEFVRSGSADDSTHTPALEALSEVFEEIELNEPEFD